MKPDQLIFAPHAIDNQRYANTDVGSAADQMRQELGIKQDEVVILFPGKLEEIKQPDLLIDAFHATGGRGHLVFVGSGSLAPILRSSARENVHFLGFKNQTEMPAMYKMADLMTLPSRSETWGLALNEAMACGCPVLASDRVGAAVDLIQLGENGWVFRQGDAVDLLDKLNAALDHGVQGLNRMGERSQEIIKEWSIPKQVDAIVNTVRLFATRQ